MMIMMIIETGRGGVAGGSNSRDSNSSSKRKRSVSSCYFETVVG